MTGIAASDLQTEIEAAWERRDALSVATVGPVRTAVEETIALVDAGRLKTTEQDSIDDFADVFDFNEAFAPSLELGPHSAPRPEPQS